MRPTAPSSRFCSATTLTVLLLALGTFASVEYRAKAGETGIYRTMVMAPPPSGLLSEGEAVMILHMGSSLSLVKTSGGMRGWVRNIDLVAVKLAEGGRHKFGDQAITGSDLNISPFLLDETDPVVELGALDRSFDGDVVDVVDREQLEMRNDEN